MGNAGAFHVPGDYGYGFPFPWHELHLLGGLQAMEVVSITFGDV
jgi:hypothetical protein